MKLSCNNCNNSEYESLEKVLCFSTKLLLSPVRCNNCGLVYLNPRPNKQLGLDYFELAYSNAKGFEDHEYYRNHAMIFKRNIKRFEILDKLTPPNKNILDFGAGQGHFVKVARDLGWSCEGTELSQSAIDAAKTKFGVSLFKSLGEIKSRDFGVIALWDVIEHLEDPRGTLKLLSNYLHSDGYFVIETANIDSVDYLLNKGKWSYWHVDHLSYFSKKTLKYLVNSIGFEVVGPDMSSPNSSTNKSSLVRRLTRVMFKPAQLFKLLKSYIINLKDKNIDRNGLMVMAAKRNFSK
jgi:2-polyprenyl-3-methyl-5-hydroxy-6-metoxy-1,4-benzoquinol methylase